MRISDWSSDVCSSDLHLGIGGDPGVGLADRLAAGRARQGLVAVADADAATEVETLQRHPRRAQLLVERDQALEGEAVGCDLGKLRAAVTRQPFDADAGDAEGGEQEVA